MEVFFEAIENTINDEGCLIFIPGYMPHEIHDGVGLYIDEENFKILYGSMEGQITRKGKFGKLIYTIASDPDGPKLWLDVGTWNGRGTTTCILDGFHESGVKKELTSVELHPFMWNVAKENLKDHPVISMATFARAKISGPSGEDYILHPPKGETCRHYRLHYETDMALWSTAETLVFNKEPEAVILDGGEYTGYVDWVFVPKGSLKYVFLDDSAILKNQKVRAELLASSEWTLLDEDLTDRNGWSAFIRN
jgi:hypothetical protein